MPKTTLSWTEAAVTTVLCFGLFIFSAFQAVSNDFPDAHFSEAGIAQMIGIELVLALIALFYLKSRNFDIGSLYPQPTLRGTLQGLLVFASAFVCGLVLVRVFQRPDQDGTIGFSFSGISLGARIALALVNGTFEEVFLLGVLVRGLRGFGLSIAIGLPLLVRLLYHVYQGPQGLAWVGGFGITLTLAYIFSRSLWPSVLAHILWDIVPTL